MKPGGVGSCIYLIKFKWKFLRFSLKVWIRAVLLRKFKEALKQWLLILEKLYLYVKNGSSNPWYHTFSRRPVNKFSFFQPWRICHCSTNCKYLQNISFRLWESQILLFILMKPNVLIDFQFSADPPSSTEHLSIFQLILFCLTASALSFSRCSILIKYLPNTKQQTDTVNVVEHLVTKRYFPPKLVETKTELKGK